MSEKLKIVVVYNGEEIEKQVPHSRTVHSLLAEILGSVSSDLNPNDFFLKTSNGIVLDSKQKLEDTVKEGDVLFLSRNDGGGGGGGYHA